MHNKYYISRATKAVLNNLGIHNSLPREWELIDLTYVITLSATAFAQLKRHRMAVMIPGPYEVSNYTIPENLSLEIKDSMIDLLKRYDRIMVKFMRTAYLAENNNAVGQYALCNAHRRTVIFKTDARELYNIAKLRMNKAAQWEIRDIVEKMVRSAKKPYPAMFSIIFSQLLST